MLIYIVFIATFFFFLTMRDIQLYFVVCKKSYSGRVMHSLSEQKANATSEKPLPRTEIV